MPPAVFTCPRCGASSAHPRDIREGYCGNCHDWTGGQEWCARTLPRHPVLPGHTCRCDGQPIESSRL